MRPRKGGQKRKRKKNVHYLGPSHSGGGDGRRTLLYNLQLKAAARRRTISVHMYTAVVGIWESWARSFLLQEKV